MTARSFIIILISSYLHYMGIRLKVRILADTDIDLNNNFSLDSLLLSPKCKYDYEYVNEDAPADLCVFGIGLKDNSRLRDNEVNILFCMENLAWWWSPKYYHYNKYKEYGDEKVDIYYYNHISIHISHKAESSDKEYLAIPACYTRIQYYENEKRRHSISQSVVKVPFSQKKFCLNLTSNNEIASKLNQLGLGMVDDQKWQDLELYSQYKFVICLEKDIFDVYLAYSIPLCFDSGSNFNYNQIRELSNDEQKYMTMLHEKNIGRIEYNYNEVRALFDKKLKAKCLKELSP